MMLDYICDSEKKEEDLKARSANNWRSDYFHPGSPVSEFWRKFASESLAKQTLSKENWHFDYARRCGVLRKNGFEVYVIERNGAYYVSLHKQGEMRIMTTKSGFSANDRGNYEKLSDAVERAELEIEKAAKIAERLEKHDITWYDFLAMMETVKKLDAARSISELKK